MKASNYILQYYQAIKDGSVTVGRWTELAYEMLVSGIEAKRYIYDQKRAAAAVLFVENFVRHHEGSLAPGKLRLELCESLDQLRFGSPERTVHRIQMERCQGSFPLQSILQGTRRQLEEARRHKRYAVV